jgi:hemerythrin-like domain-containing protein
MKATETLMREHEVILSLLDTIESVMASVRAGAGVNGADLDEIVACIVNFADRCHHAKEEGLLFPAMARSGFPANQGPIAVMLQEHERGREHVQAVRAALERLAGGDVGALSELMEGLASYVALLRNHIAKENNVLFVMADQRVGGEERNALNEAFDRAEQDEQERKTQETYRAMVARLKLKYAG